MTVKGWAKVAPRVAPELGEHTDEVLAELGFEPAQIESLHASGATSSAGVEGTPAAGGAR